jgi:hypothetical protein
VLTVIIWLISAGLVVLSVGAGANNVHVTEGGGTDTSDEPAAVIVHSGIAPDQVNVDRTAQRRLGIARTAAHGGRVDVERVGGALEGRPRPATLVFYCQRGQHLRVAQFGRPGQQVGGQLDAQPGEVRPRQRARTPAIALGGPT